MIITDPLNQQQDQGQDPGAVTITHNNSIFLVESQSRALPHVHGLVWND